MNYQARNDAIYELRNPKDPAQPKATLQAIGDQYALTRERVRQIVGRAERERERQERAAERVAMRQRSVEAKNADLTAILRQAEDLSRQLDGLCGDDRLRPLDELWLPVRARKVLCKRKVKTVGDIVELSETELLRERNCGRRSVAAIKEALAEFGLGLKP
jgi:DNA-directed RNA polymerase alpha subunit